ncbi:MAG: hypothetical protein H7A20_08430 [Rhodanobacteraceae bacterium]|mgnify:CR=1 FL=1|nr:hypothetical protein [Xanthomonadales bacterium]MCP5478793.1 hypothetical protein [Rhodanobacteraceae bacterium]HPF73800.1 hypothetical protein [Xanthomonadaceae bacterium]HRY00210.1 hypothetical protein [Xanthomonadaceae bacterium]
MFPGFRFLSRLSALLLLFLASSATLHAYELDPYYQRLTPLRDATPVLNREMNRAIADAAEECASTRSERCIIDSIFHRVGGHHWVDHLESWAWHSPEVQRIETPRKASIYYGIPFWASRNSYLFKVGPIISVASVRIGTDKIGHFLSQGRKYNLRWRKERDEAQAATWSAITERGIFGQMTTGDYSNADLVANYEGHRFYRELFEDDIVPGRKALLRRTRSGWVVQRDFDWASHVNAYWDEALNASYYDVLLRPFIEPHIRAYCGDYRRAPEQYRIDPAEDQRLGERYAFLHLREAHELRLPNLCASTGTD